MACISVNVPAKTPDLMASSMPDSLSLPVVRLSAATITGTAEGANGGFRYRTRVAQTTLLGDVWIGMHLKDPVLALPLALALYGPRLNERKCPPARGIRGSVKLQDLW